ncbi:MAG TPA: hypothetical protein VH477_11695 [Bryobacteraceae bacterium]|jgi:hypothetical protein
MSNDKRDATRGASQPDKDKAASERPVPSQAEGDLSTVEEDLREKSGSGQQNQAPQNQRKT